MRDTTGQPLLRAIAALALPVLSWLHLIGLPEGNLIELDVFGYALNPVRIDGLSLVWGHVFHIAAFVSALYALHVKDVGQHVSGMIYAGAAIGAASAVFNLNPGDAACVKPLMQDPRRLVALAPFVDTAAFPVADATGATREMLARRYRLAAAEPWLIAVAMMRPGNKHDSYRVLAEALAMIAARPWHLIIVGDGVLRAQVEALFAAFAPGRVVFTGALDGEPLRRLMAHADLFAWPGVREPIGMAMLEAQAVGLPVVTGHGPGIAAIVQDGCTGRLVARGDVAAFAGAVASLLDAPGDRAALGTQARRRVAQHHDIAAASATLDGVLRGLQAASSP